MHIKHDHLQSLIDIHVRVIFSRLFPKILWKPEVVAKATIDVLSGLTVTLEFSAVSMRVYLSSGDQRTSEVQFISSLGPNG